MGVSELIREARIEKGLSKEGLADIMDVTVMSVHKWEAGQSIPKVGKAKELIEVLGVNPVEFLTALTGIDLTDYVSKGQ